MLLILSFFYLQRATILFGHLEPNVGMAQNTWLFPLKICKNTLKEWQPSCSLIISTLQNGIFRIAKTPVLHGGTVPFALQNNGF